MKISLKFPSHHNLPGMNPMRDWNILLTVFGAAVIGCFIAGACLFYSVGSGSPAASDGSSADGAKPLDSKMISSVISTYENAPGKIQNFISGGTLLVDPSR